MKVKRNKVSRSGIAKISNPLPELLYPFRKFWNPSYCVIMVTKVGVDRWEVDCDFYSVNDDECVVPESVDIQKIVDLWDESCLYDLIFDRFLNHIFDNMIEFGIYKLKVEL